MALNLNLQLMTRAAVGGMSLPPLMLVANAGIVPNAFRQATAANFERATARKSYKLCGVPVSEIRFLFAGFYALNGSGVETLPGNDESLALEMELGAQAIPATFSGQANATITNGLDKIASDAIKPAAFGLTSFAADTAFWMRRMGSVALNAKHCKHGNSDLTGENTFYDDGSNPPQLHGTGPMAQQTGGLTAGCETGAAAVIGRCIGAPPRSFTAIGDSLPDGSNDVHIASDGSAGGGWFMRALWNVNGHTLPSLKITCGGSLVTTYMAGHAKRDAYLGYSTDYVIMFGTNDFVSGSKSVAEVLAAIEALADLCRSKGGKRIYVCKLPPRVTSTDSYATLAGQTVRTGFESGGKRDQLNAAFDASSHFDGVVHFASCEDPTDHTKWPVNGTANFATTDGTHPNNNISILMAAEASAVFFPA